MSILSRVTTGVIKKPYYLLMHGLPGLGKSTFAAKAPKPIFLCAEKGTNNLDVTRLELEEFDQFIQAIDELKTGDHPYQTVVIDTIDHVEPMIFKEVCRDKGKKSIEELGYGKGYLFALEYWKKLVDGLEAVREKGINVILLAHTEIKTFQDPQLSEGYDRYQIKLHSKASSLLVDRAECVLFANYETYLKSDDSSKAKAFGDGARVMFTEHRPAFLAKNRYNLPFKLALDWDEFVNASERKETKSQDDLNRNIDTLLAEVKDAEIKKQVEEYRKKIGNDASKLAAIENKLKTIVAA